MSSETTEQGLVKEDDNKDDETEKVEYKDMEYQDVIDNWNLNINCKENNDNIDCNNTQNMVKNEVIVNNNYKKIEVAEDCNNENKNVKDSLN